MKVGAKTKVRRKQALSLQRQRAADLQQTQDEYNWDTETLEDAKRVFENVFHGQLDAILLLDTSIPPIILDCNPAVSEMFGYTHEEMVGRTTTFLHVNEKALKAFQARLYPGLTENRCFLLPEFSMKRKDGTVFPTEHSVIPLENGGDERIGWISVIRDITKRKRVEVALRESEEKYRTLAENLNVGIYRNTAGPKGKFIEANPAIVKMFGYKNKKDLLAVNVADLYQNPEDRRKFNRKMLRDGFVKNEELCLKKKDGAPFTASVSAVVAKDENGKIQYYDGVIEDITERKRGEAALRESEEKFSNLFQRSNDAIFIHDFQGNITDVNKKVLDQFGYTKSEIVSLKVRDLHPLEVLKTSKGAFDAIARDGFVNFEIDFKKKNGEVFPAEVSASVFEIGGRKVIQGIVRNITKRKRAQEALTRKTQQQEQLVECARNLTESLDLKRVLTRIGFGAKKILKAHSCVIYLLETDGKTLSPVVAIDPTFAQEILAAPLNLKTSFTGKAVKTRRGLIFNDAAGDDAGQQIPGTPTEENERVIVAPFLVDDTVLGAMCLNRIGTVFSEEDLALAETFATYAATALHNAQTYDNLQRAIAVRERAEKDLKQSLEKSQRLLEQTVNVLASTVEMRDPYTAGHQRQVNKLACAIAEEMGLPKEQIDGIRMAALIHDIGKIYVPAEILSRPGELTETEFGLIKIHSQAGHDVLKPIEFPWPVAEIVLQHHERLNGSGFPQGLSGEEILLEARIIGVADVVEAMSSHRPYRPALGINKALEEISQNRGVLYDPQVVDVCLKVFSENGFKFA